MNADDARVARTETVACPDCETPELVRRDFFRFAAAGDLVAEQSLFGKIVAALGEHERPAAPAGLRAPLFFRRDEQGIPRGWVEKMRRSIITCLPVFNTHRMVEDYVTGIYLG